MRKEKQVITIESCVFVATDRHSLRYKPNEKIFPRFSTFEKNLAQASVRGYLSTIRESRIVFDDFESRMKRSSFFLLQQEGGPSGPTGIQQCAGCGGQIVERWLLLAMDRYWHNSCLKCTYCGAALAEIGHSCYTRSGMILCKSDYRR